MIKDAENYQNDHNRFNIIKKRLPLYKEGTRVKIHEGAMRKDSEKKRKIKREERPKGRRKEILDR